MVLYEWDKHFYMSGFYSKIIWQNEWWVLLSSLGLTIFFLSDRQLRRRVRKRKIEVSSLSFSLPILLSSVQWLAVLFDVAVVRAQMPLHSATKNARKTRKKRTYCCSWWVTWYRQNKTDGIQTEEKKWGESGRSFFSFLLVTISIIKRKTKNLHRQTIQLSYDAIHLSFIP
jgi:hypothetical protein